MIDDEKVRKIVNSSGFPLQIKVESLVNKHSHLGWKVLTKEHSWINPASNKEGFLDLVLEKSETSTLLTVECKRVKDSAWIFLREKHTAPKRRHAKAWITKYIAGNKGIFGWIDGIAYPETPESQFCVVAGQDQKSKPMIERIGAELVDATQFFADQDCNYYKSQPDFIRIFLPVIITTAELKVCEFDVEDVSLDMGEIDKSEAKTVPYLRFRKQLSHRKYSNQFLHGVNYRDIDNEKENTIFVVNSNHIVEFLDEIEIHEK